VKKLQRNNPKAILNQNHQNARAFQYLRSLPTIFQPSSLVQHAQRLQPIKGAITAKVIAASISESGICGTKGATNFADNKIIALIIIVYNTILNNISVCSTFFTSANRFYRLGAFPTP